ALKLAEALAQRRGVAVRDLPAGELERLVAAADAETRAATRARAMEKKGSSASVEGRLARDGLRGGKGG
ncbi:MAG: hypothetical protein KGL37_04010, partial [Acidobacteriota bacterium]|nr:hypothetical protein [Acidobacteriota bacterium]